MKNLKYLVYLLVIGGVIIWMYQPEEEKMLKDCIYRIPENQQSKVDSMIRITRRDAKVTPQNKLIVFYDAAGCIYVNKKFKGIKNRIDLFNTFLKNPKRKNHYAVSPDSAWIIIKAANYKSIKSNIKVLKSIRIDLIDLCYNEIRNSAAKLKFGKKYDELSTADQSIIKKKYPIQVIDDLWDQIEDPSQPIQIKPIEQYTVGRGLVGPSNTKKRSGFKVNYGPKQ